MKNSFLFIFGGYFDKILNFDNTKFHMIYISKYPASCVDYNDVGIIWLLGLFEHHKTTPNSEHHKSQLTRKRQINTWATILIQIFLQTEIANFM